MMKRIKRLIKSVWAWFFPKKYEPIFHLEYVYENNTKQENLNRAAKIKEDQRSEFVFQDEPLYKTEGQGHSFVWGFYRTYITKSGKLATHYFTRDLWLIEGEFYELLDHKFVIVPRREYKPIDPNTPVPFPIIKSVTPKIKSTELFSVQPMSPPVKRQ